MTVKTNVDDVMEKLNKLDSRLSAENSDLEVIEFALNNRFTPLEQTTQNEIEVKKLIQNKYYQDVSLPEKKARELAIEYSKEVLKETLEIHERNASKRIHNEKILKGVEALMSYHGVEKVKQESYYKTIRSKTRSTRYIEREWYKQILKKMPKTNTPGIISAIQNFCKYSLDKCLFERLREEHLKLQSEELNQKKTALLGELSKEVPANKGELEIIQKKIKAVHSASTLEELGKI